METVREADNDIELEENSIERVKIPVFFCKPDGKIGMNFKCDFCKSYHYHGDGNGHRTAHCNKMDSPYRKNGYIIILADPEQNIRTPGKYYFEYERKKSHWPFKKDL